ncbi:aldo/keto reductase [Flagellimonas zhangzhouensis]|uniref:Predicted oxidoreductase n=1 Tax=Flagellimonas zhangzhouensis TaxID=1073328 RepID=A0A1H2V3R3_9FLAO|nr:aldo/keto reductase [Allomuricauda zhangzhouensis]SDQ11196.1 Predicted oxidoreductase [Allomuricauda zhangzhouensis]SDW62880.1 Predicted oxidoreductase [Allomuricauda zhangzhouensis]
MIQNEKFSRIISGAMTWGSWGKKLSKKEMVELMHHCIEQGLVTFDHADIYGSYSTESDFGSAYAESGIERENIQLISKCGIQLTRGRDNKINHYQYDKEYIVWSAEQSLKKLHTEYLDLLLVHRPSPLMDPAEIAAAADELLSSGKIKAFGVSNFTPSQVAMLEKEIPVSGNQVEFSLTHDAPMYDGTFDDCIANKRLAMAWSPLGDLFREDNEQTQRIKKAMKPLLDKYDANESQLLLAWILKHPAKVHPVIGTTNKERIIESAAAAKIDLELQDWFSLLVASQGHDVP